MGTCERIVVLNFGQKLTEGTPAKWPPIRRSSRRILGRGCSMLEIRDLRVHYGTVEAVKGVSFRLDKGEIVSLIGANGAGKSTILRALTGLVQPSSGAVEFEGTSLAGLPSHQIIRLGIGHVPEGRRLFPKMSVLENLKMGAYLQTDEGQVGSTLAMIYQHFPILQQRGRQRAGSSKRWRAANAGHGAGLDEPSQAVAARRALHWAVADSHRGNWQDRAANQRHGGVDSSSSNRMLCWP